MGERYAPGDEVWVQPCEENSHVLHDDSGIIIEDFGTCYLVIQENELKDSEGTGWLVTDVELAPL